MGSSAASPKVFWFFGFGVFFGLGYLLWGWILPGNPSPQPIRYNHSVHIANGVACLDCHAGARDQVRATLPTIDTCLMCHADALTDSAEEEKIRTLAQSGQGIAWQQVTKVPSHVYFSHRRHVALAGLDCGECHGPVETLSEPPRRPFYPMTMDACLDCHEQRNTGNDCNRCHR